jgi:hypothetical protein
MHNRKRIATCFVVSLVVLSNLMLSSLTRAEPSRTQLETLAATIASQLAAACPMAAPDNVLAFSQCVSAMKKDRSIPFGDRLLWGGDQPQQIIRKKALTNFQKDVFQLMYLPLFAFTGEWSVTHDDRDDVEIIHIGAVFRNRLPPGEYPYPFWHSADKWGDYEVAHGINFYMDAGKVVAATRAREGSEIGRQGYAHYQPPAFDGKWSWTDPDGKPEPRVSLFSNKYSPNNPFLPQLDTTYKAFALEIREGTCVRCHAPNNRSGMGQLILLQTPVHAAGEIGNVLKAVRAGDMPQNDFGLKSKLEEKLRDAILSLGGQFQEALAKAEQWEASQTAR